MTDNLEKKSELNSNLETNESCEETPEKNIGSNIQCSKDPSREPESEEKVNFFQFEKGRDGRLIAYLMSQNGTVLDKKICIIANNYRGQSPREGEIWEGEIERETGPKPGQKFGGVRFINPIKTVCDKAILEPINGQNIKEIQAYNIRLKKSLNQPKNFYGDFNELKSELDKMNISETERNNTLSMFKEWEKISSVAKENIQWPEPSFIDTTTDYSDELLKGTISNNVYFSNKGLVSIQQFRGNCYPIFREIILEDSIKTYSSSNSKKIVGNEKYLQKLTEITGQKPELVEVKNDCAVFRFGSLQIELDFYSITKMPGVQTNTKIEAFNKYTLAVSIPEYPLLKFQKTNEVEPQHCDWPSTSEFVEILHEGHSNEELCSPEIYNTLRFHNQLTPDILMELKNNLQSNNYIRSKEEWQQILKKSAFEKIKNYRPYLNPDELNSWEIIQMCLAAEKITIYPAVPEQVCGRANPARIVGKYQDRKFNIELNGWEAKIVDQFADHSAIYNATRDKDTADIVHQIIQARIENLKSFKNQIIKGLDNIKCPEAPVNQKELNYLTIEADRAEQEIDNLIKEMETRTESKFAESKKEYSEIENLIEKINNNYSFNKYKNTILGGKINTLANLAIHYWKEGKITEAKENALQALQGMEEEDVRKAFNDKMERIYEELRCPLCGGIFDKNGECQNLHRDFIYDRIDWNRDYEQCKTTTNLAELRAPNNQLIAEIRISGGEGRYAEGLVYIKKISEFDNIPNYWDRTLFVGNPTLIDLNRILTPAKQSEKEEDIQNGRNNNRLKNNKNNTYAVNENEIKNELATIADLKNWAAKRSGK